MMNPHQGEVDGAGRIAFLVPLPPRALRRNTATVERENPKPGQSKRRSVHWSERAALKRQYQEDVWCAGYVRGGRGCPWERARLTLEWRHAGIAPDQDNALASLKSLIDVLHCKSNRPLGIVVDDSPEHLRIEPVQCVKVKHRADEGVYVEIEKL